MSVLSYVASVCSTNVGHPKTAVVKPRLTHSLAAAAPKMFSFLPFIFDLLGEPHSPQAAYLVVHVSTINWLGVTDKCLNPMSASWRWCPPCFLIEACTWADCCISHHINSSGSYEQNELSLLVVTPPDVFLWWSKYVCIKVWLCPTFLNGRRGCKVTAAIYWLWCSYKLLPIKVRKVSDIVWLKPELH